MITYTPCANLDTPPHYGLLVEVIPYDNSMHLMMGSECRGSLGEGPDFQCSRGSQNLAFSGTRQREQFCVKFCVLLFLFCHLCRAFSEKIHYNGIAQCTHVAALFLHSCL